MSGYISLIQVLIGYVRLGLLGMDSSGYVRLGQFKPYYVRLGQVNSG
jgi:hypothetical protein